MARLLSSLITMQDLKKYSAGLFTLDVKQITDLEIVMMLDNPSFGHI